MMKTTASRQHGVTFSGLLIWAIILIFLAIGGMKLIPAYVQDAEIKGIFNAIAQDPEMQGATARNIRESFSKRAMMNNISIVNAEDINIDKAGNSLLLSVSYQMKIPLAGNVSLVLEFNPSSSSK
ncbi:MAG: DUF4845 domain-containing protein [Gallionellaceae bacterium]|nr:DUF4845 domain-containing protein [Gallionellaceae bacterium]